MIKPEDLRIGNIVMLDGEQYHIRAGEQIDDYCDRMEPIVMTSTWFDVFGFTKRVGSNVYMLAIEYTESDYPCTLQRSGDGIQICRSGIGAITAPIEYVHQFQNLYRSLTGADPVLYLSTIKEH